MSDIVIARRLLSGKSISEIKDIAKRVRGLPWQTVYKIGTGRTRNPKVDTLDRIMRALSQ